MAAQRLSPPRKGGVLDLAPHSSPHQHFPPPHHQDSGYQQQHPGSPQKQISILANNRSSPQLASGLFANVEKPPPIVARPATRTLDATAAPFKQGALRLAETDPVAQTTSSLNAPPTLPTNPTARGPSRREREREGAGGRRREDRRLKGEHDEQSEMSSDGNQRPPHRHQQNIPNQSHKQQQQQGQHHASNSRNIPHDATSRTTPRHRKTDEREGDHHHHHHNHHHHHHRSSNRLDNDSARPSQGGKLFDPRRDDPVKFATMKKLSSNQGVSTASASNSVLSVSDSKSYTSTEPTAQTSSAASSEGRRRRRGPGSRSNTNDSGEKGRSGGKGQNKNASAAATVSDSNAYVLDLKRSYGEIKKLEQKLQEEHRQASEKLKAGCGSGGGGSGLDSKGEGSTSSSSASGIQTSKRQLLGMLSSSATPGFVSKGELDHSYWLQLAAQHRQLAENHAAFMDMALRPGLPSSLHALPEQYNIPIRLWQTAFHLFLERARQSMPSLSSSAHDTQHEESQESRRMRAELLEHLTDFVYFAYSYYTHLLENEKYKAFKSQWVENLGDLARSRMAIAGLQAQLHSDQDAFESPTPTQEKTLSSSLLPPANAIIGSPSAAEMESKEGDEAAKQALAGDDNDDDAAAAAAADDASAGIVEGKPNAQERPAKQQQQHHERYHPQRASIGKAALNDWDLEERETWRTTARDWYARGLAELPGTGRLHHHLGVLSRPDDLRVLHHFCKAMTSSNPYLGARESMLPLFERESQTKRLQPDAGLVDLFVHLHGMLFTKIQLDDFEQVFSRLKAHLEMSTSPNSDSEISQAAWMMMANINISAMLNYNATSLHMSATGRGTNERMSKEEDKMTKDMLKDDELARSKEDKRAKEPVSTAEKGGVTKRKADAEDDKDEDADEADEADAEDEDEDKADEDDDHDETNAESSAEETNVELPITLHHAARLTFTIFSTLIRRALDQCQSAASSASTWHLNPYVTMILTFFCHEAKQPSTLRHIEQHVSWSDIVALGNSIPNGRTIDPRKDVATKIRGDAVPLPEDWCLRGMAWVSRRVYERGFWKARSDRNGLGLVFESEVDVLQRMTEATIDDVFDVDEGTDDEEEADGQGVTDEQGRGEPSASGALGREIKARPNLLDLRWKRVIYALTILVKTIPGLDYEFSAGDGKGALVISSPLSEKMKAWALERQSDENRKRMAELHVTSQEGGEKHQDDELLVSEDDDDDDDDTDEGESDSPEVKELKVGVHGSTSYSVCCLLTTQGSLSSLLCTSLQRRRRELRQLLRDGRSYAISSSTAQTKASQGRTQRKSQGRKRSKLDVVPGYTILLLDTNVMLTATNVLENLVESGKWTSVVPLAAVTELEGLKNRPAPIGPRARAAIEYLERNIKLHSRWLKVQTSRGNYLADLRFRTEDIDFAASQQGRGSEKDRDSHRDDEEARFARSIDEVILGCLAWQESHFVDRLNLVAQDPERERSKVTPNTAKAVLVTLDRNLRLKARFRSLIAIGPNDLVELLVDGKG